MAVSQLVGARIQRREDPRLVSGHGHFVDDIAVARTLHMAVVRSPFPHARVQRIDAGAARSAPGVAAVLTAADFRRAIRRPLPVLPTFVPEKKQVPEQFPLATDEVVYEGEPVAVVLAEDRYLVSDGAALAEVGYEPLAAEIDLDKALDASSPPAHAGAPDNVGWDASFPGGDIDAAFAEAEVTVRQRMVQQRLIPNAMEGPPARPDRGPAVGARRDGHAEPDERAGCQGDRRGGHDPGHGGGHQRHLRCARAARDRARRHAGNSPSASGDCFATRLHHLREAVNRHIGGRDG
jgi:aerobic carbon-monoxide dehydrogenase large subunit